MAIYSKADRDFRLSNTETAGPKFSNLGPGMYFNKPAVATATTKYVFDLMSLEKCRLRFKPVVVPLSKVEQKFMVLDRVTIKSRKITDLTPSMRQYSMLSLFKNKVLIMASSQ